MGCSMRVSSLLVWGFVFSISSLVVRAQKDALCPAGWEIGPYKNKCFGHITDSHSWEGSESFCNEYHGHLAAVSSVQELRFAQKLCSEAVNGCWIGGRGFNSTFGVVWKWSDKMSHWNETVFLGAPFHTSCTNSSCQSLTPTISCLSVTHSPLASVVDRCNKSREFICTLDLVVVQVNLLQPIHTWFQILQQISLVLGLLIHRCVVFGNVLLKG